MDIVYPVAPWVWFLLAILLIFIIVAIVWVALYYTSKQNQNKNPLD